jgi:hypothetical protein
MGNGGMGLLQRIAAIETQCKICSVALDKRLDTLEDAQMVSKLEMEKIIKNAMEKTFNKKADVTWKIFNLLFGGGVIFAILKAVGVI